MSKGCRKHKGKDIKDEKQKKIGVAKTKKNKRPFFMKVILHKRRIRPRTQRTLSKDKKMRPVGFEPTSPGLTNLAFYSTLLWSLLRRVVSIHRLLSYEPNAIPLCYSVYAPRGEAAFENGKTLESIFIL